MENSDCGKCFLKGLQMFNLDNPFSLNTGAEQVVPLSMHPTQTISDQIEFFHLILKCYDVIDKHMKFHSVSSSISMKNLCFKKTLILSFFLQIFRLNQVLLYKIATTCSAPVCLTGHS